jgi:prepilin-type N-terminal cleavage/methylation domain-containing protein/prepilin-type processing-associated H-X9-DG protein
LCANSAPAGEDGAAGRFLRGFTLIELLVVISIISLLAGILLPSLSKARALGRGAACKGNLHAAGTALRMYLNDSNDSLPIASAMPSQHLTTEPRIADVLAPHLSSPEVLHCPGDTEKDYFTSEGSSYMYNTTLGGRQVGKDFLTHHWTDDKVFVLYDYEPFHGKPGTPGACNYLFADFHVGDIGG